MTNQNTFPLGEILGGHYTERYKSTPRYVAHVKPSNLHDYDSKAKRVPVVVVGSYRDELIVELPTPFVRHDGATFAYGHVRVSETAEGNRLVRTVLRAVKLLAQLGRDAARKRSTAAQLAARKASRAGRDGVCQICENEQIVKSGKLVLHGYERPGHGYINGRCWGVGELPWSVSCEALRGYVAMLDGLLAQRRVSLAAVPARRTFMIPESFRRDAKLIEIDRKDPRFAETMRTMIRNLEREIEQISRDIAYQSRRLDGWKATA